MAKNGIVGSLSVPDDYLITSRNVDNTPSDNTILEHIKQTNQLVNLAAKSWKEYCKVKGIKYVDLILVSGYRSKKLNEMLKGSGKNSAHMQGWAADIQPIGRAMSSEFLNWGMNVFPSQAATKNLGYDQIIIEQDGNSKWLHLGYASLDSNNRPQKRGQTLIYKNGKFSGTTDIDGVNKDTSNLSAAQSQNNDAATDELLEEQMELRQQDVLRKDEIEEASKTDWDADELYEGMIYKVKSPVLLSLNNKENKAKDNLKILYTAKDLNNADQRALCIINLLIHSLNCPYQLAIAFCANMISVNPGLNPGLKEFNFTGSCTDQQGEGLMQVKFDPIKTLYKNKLNCDISKADIKSQIEGLAYCFNNDNEWSYLYKKYIKNIISLKQAVKMVNDCFMDIFMPNISSKLSYTDKLFNLYENYKELNVSKWESFTGKDNDIIKIENVYKDEIQTRFYKYEALRTISDVNMSDDPDENKKLNEEITNYFINFLQNK